MEITWMFGLCAILMALMAQHTIHCETQETQTSITDAETAAADPQLLIQMTNNFASILESLTKLTPANVNYANNGMTAQQLQQGQPQQQYTNYGPYNPTVPQTPQNPNRPQNPNNPNNPNGPYNPNNPQRPGQGPVQPPRDRIPIPLDARDCNDVAAHAQSTNRPGVNVSSGIYMMKPQIYPVSDLDKSVKAFAAYCDMETDGGNWTVFHRRQGALVGFFRGWAEYKAGFGFLDGDHWLGLERLHQMTVHNKYELRIDLENFEGDKVYAYYDNFKIGDESTNYMLMIGAYQGTAKDSLTYHNRKPFTTKDRDNDAHKGSCAKDYKGAWWYSNCHYSNLNGLYQMRALNNDVGMTWYAWKKRHISLKKAEMKIRRVDFNAIIL